MSEECIRLSKLMSEQGLCSRREADVYIEAGQVLVNGLVISTLGAKVPRSASISLKGKAQSHQKSKVTILLNKPIGFVSTQPEKGYSPAIELILPENQFGGKQKLHPDHLHTLSVAGRLDIDSRGLLVLTQDGVIAKQIIGPESNIEKEYLVKVEGVINDRVLERLCYGLVLDNKPLKRAAVEEIQPYLLRFILREGKKRQIRRMCELVNLKVVKLKRVRIGKVTLGKLPEGKWRFLEPHEKF